MNDVGRMIGKAIGRSFAIEMVLGEFIGAVLSTQEDGAAVAGQLFAKSRLILAMTDNDPESSTVEGARHAIELIEEYATSTIAHRSRGI